MERQEPRRIDQPEPGFFKIKFARGGAWVPAKIIYVRDLDLWGAEIDGEAVRQPHSDPARAGGVMRVWTSGRRIEPEEYAYLLRLKERARGIPGHPSANPRVPADVALLPPVF